jgi:hypothetical protein
MTTITRGLIKGFNPQAYGQVRDNQVRRAAAPATA